ncbi:hypothetical protein ASG87_16730 [Frateuria sp. Soil773]|uniref:fimbrial protein n=1 Tax=Frateuria sp. Soil773 TaxID=1736407 RepID=UPI0006F4BD37|nr:fimbrial protein [Frateuria sp. Soil773]KRE96628.1 hypothetical protein ASG87_16730 [Frateuria sp. Soil773]
MIKSFLSAALIAGLGVAAFAPQSARADDGTINIDGRVLAQSCKVENNANGTAATINVHLPWVYAPTLNAAGSTTGDTAFPIHITDCDAALTSVKTYFSGANIDTTTGYLKQTTSGGANNVQIQLLNSDNSAITLNGGDATAQNSKPVTMSNGAATLNYVARYISPQGSATPGAVTSSVQFTLVYQ